jgi:ketosteroid isomerase-like protein
MTEPDAIDVAVRLFGAIQAGDLDAVRDIYAPNAEIWHNYDGIVQTPDENLVVLRWVVTHLDGIRYEDVVRQPTPTGFVQQHVLRATAKGTPIEMPACIVVTVVDQHITRLDEYLDSAHVARLAAAVAG